MDENQLAEKWAELILLRLSQIKDDWQQPWVSAHIRPMNLSGREYKGGSNILLLMLDYMNNNYSSPIYLTWHQAISLGLNFKGATMFPVTAFNIKVQPKNKFLPKITLEEYQSLTKQEQRNYNLISFAAAKYVMNIDNTNYAKKYPDRWEKMQELPSFEHSSSNELLDQLITQQAWYCPIKEKLGSIAAYYPMEDFIALPHRQQFEDISKFYSTLLHEITHSTGASSRLKRLDTNNSYAYEELVAELGAIFTGFEFKVNREIDENNLTYIKGWHERISSDPKYILRAVKDALKASQMIVNKINELKPTIQLKTTPEKTQRELIMENLNQELIYHKNNTQSNHKKIKR